MLSTSNTLAAGNHTLFVQNPDEETGFAGKRNTDLHPDMREYTTRSILSVTKAPNGGHRTIIVPEDLRPSLLQTLEYIRDDRGLKDLLNNKDVVGVPFNTHDTIFSAIGRSSDTLQSLLSSVDALSYTIHSQQVQQFRQQHPDIYVPGNYRSSEHFNNKASAEMACRLLKIPRPNTRVAFSRDQAIASYRDFRKNGVEKVIVKGGRTAGGYAVSQPIVNEEELLEELDRLSYYLEPDNYTLKNVTPYNSIGIILQEFHENIKGSPSAAIIVGSNKEHTFLGINEQELCGGKQHVGNTYPLHNHYSSDVQKIIQDRLTHVADSLSSNGVCDVVLAEDLLVLEDDTVLHCEFNFRLPSTYGGFALTRDLYGSEKPDGIYYHTGTYELQTPLQHSDFVSEYAARLQQGSVEYDPNTKVGVIPLSIFATHMRGVMFARSASELAEFKAVVQS
jgi:hypothetical protein